MEIMKTRNITTANIGKASHLLVTTLSILSERDKPSFFWDFFLLLCFLSESSAVCRATLFVALQAITFNWSYLCLAISDESEVLYLFSNSALRPFISSVCDGLRQAASVTRLSFSKSLSEIQRLLTGIFTAFEILSSALSTSAK